MIGATTWRSWIIHEFAEAIRNFAKIARWVMSPIVSGESDGEIGDLDEDVSYDEKPCNSYTAVIYICTDCTTFKMNHQSLNGKGVRSIKNVGRGEPSKRTERSWRGASKSLLLGTMSSSRGSRRQK